MNIHGDNNLMVAMVVFNGGSKLRNFNCTNVHRAPLNRLADRHKKKPIRSKFASPLTVKYSPMAIIRTTINNCGVMRSIPNKYAHMSTNIGVDDFTMV